MPQRDAGRQALAHPRTPPPAGRLILARNLKKWRRARNLSQEYLAELSGLARAYISQLEHAHRNVSLDHLCQIAAGLGIHPQRLLDDDETEASGSAGAR